MKFWAQWRVGILLLLSSAISVQISAQLLELDSAFDPRCNGEVYALALQTDGKILVGGKFTQIGGQSRTNLARLNRDGTVDALFDPRPNGPVFSMATGRSGEIFVVGEFSQVQNRRRYGIAKLRSAGSVDDSFECTPVTIFYALCLQADGKILVGPNTNYHRYTDFPRSTPEPARLNPDGSFDAQFSAPEIWRATLDWSADGLGWSVSESGQRIPGGWEWQGVPTNAAVRLCGTVTGGMETASSWIIEDFDATRPLIFPLHPWTRTNLSGSIVSFAASAAGALPLTYQWFRGEEPLVVCRTLPPWRDFAPQQSPTCSARFWSAAVLCRFGLLPPTAS